MKAEIDGLLEEGKYQSALDVCSAWLGNDVLEKIEALRMRAFVHGKMGEYESAAKDRLRIIEECDGVLGDYFRLGENYVSAGNFAEASRWLESTLREAKRTGEAWFDSAAYLLLAYSQARIGEHEEAKSNLEVAARLDADVRMPLVNGEWASLESVKSDIQRFSTL